MLSTVCSDVVFQCFLECEFLDGIHVINFTLFHSNSIKLKIMEVEQFCLNTLVSVSLF